MRRTSFLEEIWSPDVNKALDGPCGEKSGHCTVLTKPIVSAMVVRTRRLTVDNCIVVFVRPHYHAQPGCTNYASQLAHARTHTGQTFQWQSMHPSYSISNSCARIWGPTQRALPDSDVAAGGRSPVIAGCGRRLCVASG